VAGRQWTIRDVLTWTEGYLARHDDEHPKLSAQWLVCDATGHTRVELFLNYDKPLTQAELDHLHEGIERRAAGEPLQYVTGEMPFRHIVLKCERGVLIPQAPRPRFWWTWSSRVSMRWGSAQARRTRPRLRP